jgi:hypothetical protein
MLCLDRYADHTSRETWDYSAWIRAYGVFLDERLDAFRCRPAMSLAAPSTAAAKPQQESRSDAPPARLRAALPSSMAVPQPSAPFDLFAGPQPSPRAMRFDPESGAHAARQQQGYGMSGPGGYGGYGGPTGGSGYGGPTGGYGGPTGGGYGGQTGGAYGGPTGGGYSNGATGNGQAAPPTASSLKDCSAEVLLERLPRMQRLMLRMLACVPEGAAAAHPVCLVSVQDPPPTSTQPHLSPPLPDAACPAVLVFVQLASLPRASC